MPEELIVKHGVCFVPVLHGRAEFALAVKWATAQYQPEVIAAELPRSLGRAAGEVTARLPNISVILSRRGDETTYLLAEPTDPIMEALRTAGELGIPGLCIDAETEGYPENGERWPDSYALTRLGLDGFTRPFLNSPPPPNELDLLREQTMAHRLGELTAKGQKVLFVCGLGHARRIMDLLESPQPLPFSRIHGAQAQPANLHPDSIKEVCNEIPNLMKRYEELRARVPGPENWTGGAESFDRILAYEDLYSGAGADFHKATGEEIKPWQYRVMRRFRRNWALLRGGLSPDFYQLVLTAKGVGGDEYAHCLYKLAVDYPWTELEPSWETISLSAADLGRHQKKVSFFRPLRRTRRRLMPLPEKPLAREGYPGQWARMWAAGAEGICSHPPEDLIIEKFGKMSGQKALARLAQSNRLVEPFSVSLRDGIDLRETLRRLAEDKIYVYEERNRASKVGAVVVVFDPDEDRGPEGEERFPWKLTWLGEHQDESDMAFYATQPGEDLVGPGISRCVYGGLVMTYPPLRMLDIWTDPFFDWARSKAERLLLAGADYSRERVIAYLAKRPPSARARAAVQRMGRQIAYLPLGMFSPAVLQKIRYFHVLSGHNVREYAEEYIGKR